MNICSFKPCGKDAVAKGLCMGHYKQQLNNKPLTPIVRKEPNKVVDGHKKCNTCGRTKPVSEFYVKDKYPRKRYSGDCKVCYTK